MLYYREGDLFRQSTSFGLISIPTLFHFIQKLFQLVNVRLLSQTCVLRVFPIPITTKFSG